MGSRPPLRLASLDTYPTSNGGEELRERTMLGALPPEGGEVAPRSGDGVGEGVAVVEDTVVADLGFAYSTSPDRQLQDPDR